MKTILLILLATLATAMPPSVHAATGSATTSDTTLDTRDYTLAASAAPETGGSVAGGGSFALDAVATLTATAAPGYAFTGWSGDATGSVNPLAVTMNASKVVVAQFAPIQYTVTVAATSNGTITGGGSYDSGTTATLTATPASGYRFTGWTGDASGTTNPLGITVTANVTIGATFAQVRPTWTNPAGGSWPVTGNWLNANIGSGTGILADFNTLDLTADTTVTLDGARTIGGLMFGDVTPSHNWTLVTGTGGPVTLAVATGTPTVDVVNRTSTIGVVLTGSQGLAKTGDGTLVLTATNLYTGATSVAQGMFVLGNNTSTGSLAATSPVDVAAGAGIRWYRSNTTQVTLGNIFSGTGTISLAGAGAVDSASDYGFSADNSLFTGTWALDGGRLAVTAPSQLGGGSIDVRANGQLLAGGAFSLVNPITITDSSGWRDSSKRLGAIRLEGNSNLTGNILLNQVTGIVNGDGTGLNATICGYSAGTHALSGIISGSGELSMSRYTSWNGGTTQTVNIDLTGTSSNTYTGRTVVDGQGGLASLRLMKTGGAVAITDDNVVQLGSATSGQANLRMGDTTATGAARNQWDNQFGTSNGGVVLNFANASGQWMRFDLQGTNQTVAGLNAGTATTQGGAVIQNQNAQNFDPGQNATLTLVGSGTYIYNGYLRDQDNAGTTRKLNLVWNGSGQQTLAGIRIIYTGNTTVSQGKLVFSGSYGSPTLSVASGAVLELSVASGTTFYATSTISGGGTLLKTGDGTASWGTQAGTFAMGAGSLVDVSAGTLIGSSNANEIWTNNKADLNVAYGAIFDAAEASSVANGGVFLDSLTGTGTIKVGIPGSYANKITFGVDNGSGVFHGVLANSTAAGSFVKAGTGTQVLLGANTYTGTTTINSGTLQIGNGGTTGTLGTGAVTNNAGLVINRSNAITVGNPISGTGVLTKHGMGTLTLTGTHTFTGDMMVNEGGLVLATSSSYTIHPAGNGVTNRFHVLAGASLALEGSLIMDLSSASANVGNIWQVVAGPATYGGTFQIPGFVHMPTGKWTKVVGLIAWVFDQGSGFLECKSALAPTITAQPVAATVVAGSAATLDVTATGSGLTYQWFLGESGVTTTPLAGQSGPQMVLNGLAPGTHSVWVRITNADGQADSDAAQITVTPAPGAPSVLPLVVQSVTHDSVTVAWTASEPVRVEARVATGTNVPEVLANDNAMASSGTLTVNPLASATAHSLQLWITNAGGASAASSIVNFTTLAKADLSVSRDDLSATPALPALGGAWTVAALVRNTGDVAAAAAVVFYLREPGEAAVEIGRIASPTILVGGSATVPLAAPPLDTAGYHEWFVALENITPGDDVAGNNQTTAAGFHAGGPARRFEWTPNTIMAMPGESRTVAFAITNTGGQSQQIDSIEVIGTSLLVSPAVPPAQPLAPGQQSQIAFTLNVPSGELAGTATEARVVPVTVRATSGGVVFDAAAEIHLYPVGSSWVLATIRHKESLAPVLGAMVITDVSASASTTNASGQATLIAPPGTRTVSVFAGGFIARTVTLQTIAGANAVTIDMEPGDSMAVEKAVARTLGAEEIAERGIALTDPANQMVVDFTLTTKVEIIRAHNMILPRNPTAGQSTGGSIPLADGGRVDYNIINPVAGDPDQRVEVWIVIPGQVRMLKQFWDASVAIHNQTDSFVIENVQATLNISSGLSLPDLSAVPQTAIQAMGNLGPRSSATALWVVRGDVPGKYLINATATGNLRFGPTTIPLDGEGEAAEIEVIEPRIRITHSLSKTSLYEGEAFDLNVTVENLSPIDLNGMKLILDESRLENCALLAGETTQRDLGTLGVNGSASATFHFVALVPGDTWWPIDPAWEALALNRNIYMGITEAAPYVLINPESYTISSHAQSYDIVINANVPWGVTGLPSWLGVSAATGAGPHSLTVTAQENPGPGLRQTIFMIGPRQHTLTQLAPAAPPEEYTLIITATHGSVARSPAQTVYPAGQNVTLTATPDAGYVFTGWSGDIVGATNPISITMNAAMSIQANFSPQVAFTSWPGLSTLPEDRRDPLDRNGPMDLPNVLAYAMGLDPLAATSADLPAVSFVNDSTGRAGFRYRRSKTITGTTLTPMTSSTMGDWAPAVVLQSSVIQDGGEWERIEIQVATPPDGKLFFMLKAD